MNKEQKTSQTTEPAIAVEPVLATVDNKTYKLTNDKIKVGLYRPFNLPQQFDSQFFILRVISCLLCQIIKN